MKETFEEFLIRNSINNFYGKMGGSHIKPEIIDVDSMIKDLEVYDFRTKYPEIIRRDKNER